MSAVHTEKLRRVAYRSKDANPDDYVMLTAKDAGKEYRLLIERSKTFRELADEALRYVRLGLSKRAQPAMQSVVLTLDKAGKQAPGKFDGPIGDQLSDGQVLYASYVEMIGGGWTHYSGTIEGPGCYGCGVRREKLPTVIGALQIVRVCSSCTGACQVTGRAKNGKSLRCFVCGFDLQDRGIPPGRVPIELQRSRHPPMLPLRHPAAAAKAPATAATLDRIARRSASETTGSSTSRAAENQSRAKSISCKNSKSLKTMKKYGSSSHGKAPGASETVETKR